MGNSSSTNTKELAKKFINDPLNTVEEMVSGLCTVHPDKFVQLEGYTVIMHRNIDEVKAKQVTLLSGGGSGHEPAHAGYIGDGMLSGAVLGGVFASPSTTSVLAAIRAVGGPHGVLMIVKNYTGDRINFGQAALRAQAEGINVEMVVVADDCALPEGKGVTGGRGVAGTVFVHKAAGAAAAKGLSLSEVAAMARSTAAAVKTLGVAMTTCTVPGTAISKRLDSKTIEVGLGIHGEPGMMQCPWKSASALVTDMIDVMEGRLPPPATPDVEGPRPVALMVNNLGSTPTMEQYIVAHDALRVCRIKSLNPKRIMVGTFMTSLEMHGVSLSLLPLDLEGGDVLLESLDEPTTALAWVTPTSKLPPLANINPQLGNAVEAACERKITESEFSGHAVKVLMAACDALAEAEPQLTAWDQVAGDGDCGITMQRGAVAVRQVLPELEGKSASSACAAIADAVANSMGGTSGALIEIAFRAGSIDMIEKAKQSITEEESSIEVDYAAAFFAGTQAISSIGGADRGMRTMLDALMPAADVLLEKRDDWVAAARAAEKGANATAAMSGHAGRSNYVNDVLLMTVPDPGAKAVAIAMRAALQTAKELNIVSGQEDDRGSFGRHSSFRKRASRMGMAIKKMISTDKPEVFQP